LPEWRIPQLLKVNGKAKQVAYICLMNPLLGTNSFYFIEGNSHILFFQIRNVRLIGALGAADGAKNQAKPFRLQ